MEDDLDLDMDDRRPGTDKDKGKGKDMDGGDEHGTTIVIASVVQKTKWHRKALVLIAIVVIASVWALRNNKLQPFLSTVTDDVHTWTTWALSPAGEHLIATLIALIVIDVAVDWAFGAWSARRD